MDTEKPLILIVEDDKETAKLNKRMLSRRGYDALTAHNAAEAREVVRGKTPDLFVLDILLPDGDGLALCKEFRQQSDAPVIFLTGQKTIQDKIAGLGGGGDYYLTKPYSIDEFLAVVERLLNRTQQERKKVTEATVIRRGPITLQIQQRAAIVREQDAGLTSKEFAVLHLLMQNEDVEMSSETIFRHIWQSPMNNDSGALRVQIARLKKKLDEENTDDFSIIYRKGKGYTFTLK